MSTDNKVIPTLVTQLLQDAGEDTSREGLLETPTRVARMYADLLSGYSEDPASVAKTFSNDGYTGLIIVKGIRFYTLCEHHMIPFFGSVHIGYIPNGKVLGLSKFARLVSIFSRRLQTQENLTHQLARELEKHLKPKGLIVLIEAEHLCMSMRGIKTESAITKTVETRGVMVESQMFTHQFFQSIHEAMKSSLAHI